MTYESYETTNADKTSKTELAKDQAAVVKDQAAQEAGAVKDTALDAGQDVKNTAMAEAADLRDHAMDHAQDLVAQTRDQVGTRLADGQDQLAKLVREVSDELHGMATGNVSQRGYATEFAGQLAGQGQQIASFLEQRQPADVLDEVRRFAARRPMAFLGISLAAGVLVGRAARGLQAAQEPQRSSVARSQAQHQALMPGSQPTYPSQQSTYAGQVNTPLGREEHSAMFADAPVQSAADRYGQPASPYDGTSAGYANLSEGGQYSQSNVAYGDAQPGVAQPEMARPNEPGVAHRPLDLNDPLANQQYQDEEGAR